MREVLIALLLLPATGCIVAGGYSSGRGWFIWPGSFALIAIVVVLFSSPATPHITEKLLRQIDGNLRPNKL